MLNTATYCLFLAFIFLQICDVLTTIYIIDVMGGKELNPAMAWIAGKIGLVSGLLVSKVIALLVLCYVILVLPVPPSAAKIVMFGVNFLYVVVVVRNFVVIARK